MDTHKKTHLHLEYRECLKNHAASIGAHALDGCGEFAPSASSTPSDPSSITCAACGCHRNFHRRVLHQSDDDDDGGDEMAGSHVLLTLKTGDGAQGCGIQRSSGRRRRFRSRFSKEQKEGMMELAERLGWRLQRRDEWLVEEGCRKVGVERGVFKVWMHNNKQVVLEMKRSNREVSGGAFSNGGVIEERSGDGVGGGFCNGGGVDEKIGNGVVGVFSNGPSSSSPHSCSHG